MDRQQCFPVFTIRLISGGETHGICSPISEFYRYVLGRDLAPSTLSQEIGNLKFNKSDILHQRDLSKFCSVHGISLAIFELTTDDAGRRYTTHQGTFIGNSAYIIPILSLGNNVYELIVSRTVVTNDQQFTRQFDIDKREIVLSEPQRTDPQRDKPKTPFQSHVHLASRVPDAPKKDTGHHESFVSTRDTLMYDDGDDYDCQQYDGIRASLFGKDYQLGRRRPKTISHHQHQFEQKPTSRRVSFRDTKFPTSHMSSIPARLASVEEVCECKTPRRHKRRTKSKKTDVISPVIDTQVKDKHVGRNIADLPDDQLSAVQLVQRRAKHQLSN